MLLSLSGVLLGGLTVFVGLPMPWEPIAWVVCFVAWMVFALRNDIPQPFVTIVAAGPMCGIFTAITQLLFFDVYQAQNPWYAEQLADGLTGDLMTGLLMQGIVLGGVFGAVFGLITLVIHNALGRGQ